MKSKKQPHISPKASKIAATPRKSSGRANTRVKKTRRGAQSVASGAMRKSTRTSRYLSATQSPVPGDFWRINDKRCLRCLQDKKAGEACAYCALPDNRSIDQLHKELSVAKEKLRA